MIDLVGQIKSIGGDLISNAGIVAQVGALLTNEGYEIGGVKIDLIIDQSHDSTVTATSYPIEFGANVTDHIYANPNSVTVSGIISDMEIGNFFDVGLIGTAGKVKGLATGDSSTKSSQSWKKLKEIQRSGQLLKLVTELQEYDNMAIISMTTKQDKDSNTEVRFNMNLREIFIVGSERYKGDLGKLVGNTKPPSKKRTESKRAAENKNTDERVAQESKQGLQPGTEPDPGSLIYQGFKKITGK